MDPSGASEIFLNQGLLGAVVVVQFAAIVILFRTLQGANTARVDDLVKSRETTEEHTAAVRELANVLRTQTDRLDRIEREFERR
jgi:hypothetical protein